MPPWLRAVALLSLAASPAISAEVADQPASMVTPTGTLQGSLLAPAAGVKAPAVLMIAGSGPTDRDGNSTTPGVTPNTLKLLAQGLASRGITTLRADKRGVGESATAMRTEADLRFETYSDDARAWARQLKLRASAPCVWLLGHSEGALVAEVAAQGNADICGLVLISGTAHKAGDLLRTQLAGLAPPARERAYSMLAELEAGQTIPGMPAGDILFRPSVQPYLISWFAHDPAALLGNLRIPVLILQGTHDVQVDVANAEMLARAKPDASLVKIVGMNHVLKPAPQDRAANVATYADPNLPLAPGVVEAIAEFVTRNGA